MRAFVEQALYTSALYKCIKQALYLTYLNASAGIPAEITISVNGVTGLDKITIGVYNAGSGADPQSFSSIPGSISLPTMRVYTL